MFLLNKKAKETKSRTFINNQTVNTGHRSNWVLIIVESYTHFKRDQRSMR